MSIILPALGITFAAFCVWLTVRIVNRRERWAKWTLAAVLNLPVLYVASFGPACWVSSRSGTGGSVVSSAYQPILRLAFHSPGVIGTGILRYAQIFSNGDWTVAYVGGRYQWGEMPL